MSYIDIFNGDADGICALHQLRLQTPRPDARLISGVKRDIQLLNQLEGTTDSTITVLDISLDRNREPLEALLASNNSVFYVDHHYAGDIPDSPLLKSRIDPAPETCTSLIIDKFLEGKYRDWAIAAAFGDNMHENAKKHAATLSLSGDQIEMLREVGTLLNYNGYGAAVEDLYFSPVKLYQEVHEYLKVEDFYSQSPVLAKLRQGYEDDMRKANDHEPILQNNAGRIYKLPSASWARRVSGVFSNQQARQKPDLAHALIVKNNDSSLRISVRAPLNNRHGADILCRRFPSGGGRAAAAGINALPASQYEEFIKEFTEIFSDKNA